MKSNTDNLSSTGSQWSQYFDNSSNSKDIYWEYKDFVSYRIEKLISEVMAELLSNKEYDSETAKKMAINLIMEQLLPIQYKETPTSQTAMILNLFVDSPNTIDFKKELIENIEKNTIKKVVNKLSFFQRVKLLFNII